MSDGILKYGDAVYVKTQYDGYRHGVVLEVKNKTLTVLYHSDIFNCLVTVYEFENKVVSINKRVKTIDGDIIKWLQEDREQIMKEADKFPSLKEAISGASGCKDVAGDYVLRDPEHMSSFIPPYTKPPLGYCRQYEIDEQWRKVTDIFKHRIACMNMPLSDCTKYTACIGCPHRGSLDGFKSAMKFVIEHVEGKEIK